MIRTVEIDGLEVEVDLDLAEHPDFVYHGMVIPDGEVVRDGDVVEFYAEDDQSVQEKCEISLKTHRAATGR